ncbi:UNVERIFIED_CONTAM: hypothetical protein HDU68_008146 [Siphonaria sp. JEL0065]|nr:hypothetical protein HDU68_008146 [Siphonaria sp. JEL0065]
MLDAIELCDAVVSSSELRIRAEHLVTVKLDRLIYFLAGFCNDKKEASGSGVCWGVELVVPVLHLVVVASEVKGEELPGDVIDSNHIKYIIVDSLRTSSHRHVISCSLNILAQCPSRDFFVEAFAEINRTGNKKSGGGVGSGHRPSGAFLPNVGSYVSLSGLKAHDSAVDQMSDSMADLGIDADEGARRTPMEQLDEAERSLQVLTQLEKEVGNIAERMKKEMELKEAIAERKIAAHESKALLLKNELTELKEMLDEKIIVIRQLEMSQSEAFRRNSEYNALIVSHDSEKRRYREDLENSRLMYHEVKENADDLERLLKDKSKQLNEKTDALESTRKELAELTEKCEDLEKVLEATSMDCERQLNEFKDRLSVKEDLESKLLVEVKGLKNQLVIMTEEKDRLGAMVEKYNEESREHDDLVKRLAQLANLANKRGV